MMLGNCRGYEKSIKILGLLLLSILASCAAPYYIYNNFKYPYDGETKDFEAKINTSGFYYSQSIVSRKRYIKPYLKGDYVSYVDTIYSYYMFFNDGICAYNILTDTCQNPECLTEAFSKSQKDTLNKIYATWGRYIIDEDTIKAQYITPASKVQIAHGWTGYNVYYKIIDRNTIVYIYSKPFFFISESDEKMWENRIELKVKNFIFSPLDTMPSTDNRLKESTWFWVNDSIKTVNGY